MEKKLFGNLEIVAKIRAMEDDEWYDFLKEAATEELNLQRHQRSIICHLQEKNREYEIDNPYTNATSIYTINYVVPDVFASFGLEPRYLIEAQEFVMDLPPSDTGDPVKRPLGRVVCGIKGKPLRPYRLMEVLPNGGMVQGHFAADGRIVTIDGLYDPRYRKAVAFEIWTHHISEAFALALNSYCHFRGTVEDFQRRHYRLFSEIEEAFMACKEKVECGCESSLHYANAPEQLCGNASICPRVLEELSERSTSRGLLGGWGDSWREVY